MKEVEKTLEKKAKKPAKAKKAKAPTETKVEAAS